ncbi:Lipopolysaccharide export system ATP-binding protein LptB [compost metagenome]
MDIISACNMNLSYKNKVIFDNANISIPWGSITGLLGANGTGKTTFFDVICGLKNLSGGSICKKFSNLIYLSQTLSMPATLKMSDIYHLVAILSSSAPSCAKNTFEKLEKWSPQALDRYLYMWNKKPAICSYGEIRSFFALSLLTLTADLIILDEPTAGVDPEFRYLIWLCIQEARANGATILVSSHDVQEIAKNTDAFYMIAQKKFSNFQSDIDYMQHFHASTLDEAFIKATSLPHSS